MAAPDDAPDPTPTATRTVTVPVSGMTCSACESRVAQRLRDVPGVVAARVSRRSGRAVLTVDRRPSLAELDAALRPAGYRVGRAPWLSRDPATWVGLLVGAVLVAVLAVLLTRLDLGAVGAAIGDPGSGGLAVVLLLGVAAGFSTCLALVGGLVLAVSAAHAAAEAADGRAERPLPVRMRPHLAFNVGRVVGFTVLGAVLGAVGASLRLPTGVLAGLLLAVAVVMALLGLRLTGVSPRLAAWTPTLPPGLGRALGLDAAAAGRYGDLRAGLLGAATFVLPCGFTQAVQVYALATASPLTAGLVMGVFAVGTTPGLLLLAGVPQAAAGSRRVPLLRLVGVVVLVFAAVNAVAGLRLTGLDPLRVGGADRTAAAPTSASPNVRLAGGVQTVTMTQQTHGYLPADTVVYAGLPIRWVVTAEDRYSCSAFLRVPDLGVSVDLPAGTTVVDLPALPAGETTFTCVMGMYSGRFIAVPAPGSA